MRKAYKYFSFNISWKDWHVVYYLDCHFVLFKKHFDFWAFPTKRNTKKGIKRYINWNF